MKKWKLIFILAVVFLVSLMFVNSESEWVRPLGRFFGGYENGGTTIDETGIRTAGNLTVAGDVINLSVINYNVTGDIDVDGSVTASIFLGNGSLLTGINKTLQQIVEYSKQVSGFDAIIPITINGTYSSKGVVRWLIAVQEPDGRAEILHDYHSRETSPTDTSSAGEYFLIREPTSGGTNEFVICVGGTTCDSFASNTVFQVSWDKPVAGAPENDYPNSLRTASWAPLGHLSSDIGRPELRYKETYTGNISASGFVNTNAVIFDNETYPRLKRDGTAIVIEG